jgi:hypothetical protein
MRFSLPGDFKEEDKHTAPVNLSCLAHYYPTTKKHANVPTRVRGLEAVNSWHQPIVANDETESFHARYVTFFCRIEDSRCFGASSVVQARYLHIIKRDVSHHGSQFDQPLVHLYPS